MGSYQSIRNRKAELDSFIIFRRQSREGLIIKIGNEASHLLLIVTVFC